jgi:hypothetical protein
MMCKILKPHFNEYVLTNNVLLEACDTAKGDLFGDPDINVRNAYAISKALQQMGHTVKVIFTSQCDTMQTANTIMLKEEMDRQKAAKSSMSRQVKVNYVNNWKKDNDTFLCDTFGFEDGPQFNFLTGIFISPSTSKEQFPFLQQVLQVDAAHMSFGKYTLHSVYGTNANGIMSGLGFALLFGNKDKQSWTQFWNFIKKTHPTINQSKYTIITNQDKGSLSAIEEIIPLVGRFLCSFHGQHNIMKKCVGGTGQRPLSAMWLYNLLMGCKSVASLSATRKQYKEKMYPTDRHYLFNIAEEMQFPAARCVQGNSVCMYGKSASSGVEAMNRANEEIRQKTAVDILNATLILLKKESTRNDKQQNLEWNHAHVFTPKGMELMEEAFNNVNVQDFKVHLTENKNEHTAIVSKKSTSHIEYSVKLSKSATLGSRFGTCTCGFPKKEGIPCQHMVAVS